ncbi:MAG: hypothetical protein M4579_003862 [Chaenotheca gracillima]|nr:MAG: hypothetical protein M4579_003862 [Chaenotheca gracillima]
MVACFFCKKALDGWENDDNPSAEHIHHSPSCAWAILQGIEQRLEGSQWDEEDPLNERLTEARRSTFADQWPHDEKRGWTCKTEKMVGAGWFYCPTPDSDDFVTCAYCSLSLDGWEPKDKPLDEHRQRSPNCMFFALTDHVTSKPTGRGKKGRSSKASRASTQSNVTWPESSSIDIADLGEGDSALTNATTISTTSAASKPTKKVGRPKKAAGATRGKKGRTTHTTRAEDSSVVDAEIDDSVATVETKPARATRARKQNEDSSMVELPVDDSIVIPEPKSTRATKGRKRASDEMDASVANQYEREGTEDTVVQAAPPAKRRATRTSSRLSHVPSFPANPLHSAENVDVDMAEAHVRDEAPGAKGKKGAREGRRTRSSSIKAPARNMSTASKASLRMEIPDDEEIDKYLEAELDRPLTDDENLEDTPGKEQGTVAQLKPPKQRSKKPAASVAPVRKTSRTKKAEQEAEREAETDSAMLKPQGTIEEPAHSMEQETQIKSRKQTVKTSKVSNFEAVIKTNGESFAIDHPLQEQSHGRGEQSPVSLSSPQAARSMRAPTRKASNQIKYGTKKVSAIPEYADLTLQSLENDSGHETDISFASKPKKARASKQQPSIAKPEVAKKRIVSSRKAPDVVKSATTAEADHEMPEMSGALPQKAVTRKVGNDKASEDARTASNSQKQVVQAPQNAKTILRDEPSVEPSSSLDSKAQSARALPSGSPQPKSQATKKPAKGKKVAMIGRSGEVPVPPTPPQATKQATPSPSPQSSDAENQPPSSRPQAFTPLKSPHPSRTLLEVGTPTTSPSRRNALNTTCPWNAVDLETVFVQSPSTRTNTDKENADLIILDDAIQGVKGKLTSPEKKMTVEQWIKFNASLSEDKMKGECERLVSVFEMQGNRAMQTLEGLHVLE